MRQVRRPLQDPPVAHRVVLIARIVACGDAVCANLPRAHQKLIELQMVVAKRAGNWRPSGKILRDKRPHNIALEALLLIDHVIGNSQRLGHAPRVIHVIDRAAAPLHLLRHALVASQAALVP